MELGLPHNCVHATCHRPAYHESKEKPGFYVCLSHMEQKLTKKFTFRLAYGKRTKKRVKRANPT